MQLPFVNVGGTSGNPWCIYAWALQVCKIFQKSQENIENLKVNSLVQTFMFTCAYMKFLTSCMILTKSDIY